MRQCSRIGRLAGAVLRFCAIFAGETGLEVEYVSKETEIELGMVKLESVREVLFQALLLDDVKFEDGKMYAELCTILLIK